MYLQYDGKKSEEKILNISPCMLNDKWDEVRNKLIFGDNLKVLKTLIDHCKLKSKVHLVYIDPPFATNNNFTIGENRVRTISNSFNDNIAYSDNLTGGLFLEFLRERLLFIRELMSEKASIYLHIDYKIGHYVKIIMDEVFGSDNFRNDITRIKCNPKNFKRKSYGNIKDMILFYSKNKNNVWNEPKDDFTTEDINRLFRKVDKDGRLYTTIPLHAPGETRNGPTGQKWRGIKPPKGRHWRSEPEELEKLDKKGLIEWSKNGVPRKKIYADEQDGKKKQDIWEYKDAQYPDYPTQKNIDILKTIISASSNPGDLVLDCFCGSGTTLLAAEELGRYWIGIDKSPEAIKVTKMRLSKITKDLFSKKLEYQYLEEIKD
ncbi:SAM-dependent methyltransferase [Desulfonema limicola]|uniref:Methyltransferase n=1 Tax=Desulfonema limicola TaxID=45656 RepID=A0A975GEG4_9BACT|nr:site-specific DNA-methyltransferase [Desulfonema limicola]QTA78192.1 SAM-dependent methyltransferase [Desulfonema limicola]